MILHLCVLEKFTSPFYRFTEENPSDFGSDHQFYINDIFGKFSAPKGGNVYIAQNARPLARYAWLVKNMNRSNKIILHGLLDMRALLLLCLQPWLLAKCYWAIWGVDLYIHQFGERTLSWRRNEVIRRFAISRIGHLITHLRGDYDLAQKWYGAKGAWHDCFMYLSNLHHAPAQEVAPHDGINILLGNSADASNNHLDALERLRPFADKSIRIFCPLSYGDESYAQTISDYGRQVFGDRFIPLLDFMPFEEYLSFLCKIDIAILNHERQQGVGITTTLLGLGKKVYMRRDISSYRMFNDLGVKVFPIDNLVVDKLTNGDAKINKQIVESHFSRERLIDSWKKIYE